MVERAFQWAENNKKLRVNKIHGEPEAFLVLTDGFEISSTDVHESIQEGKMEVEEKGYGPDLSRLCTTCYIVNHPCLFPTVLPKNHFPPACRTARVPCLTPPCPTSTPMMLPCFRALVAAAANPRLMLAMGWGTLPACWASRPSDVNYTERKS